MALSDRRILEEMHAGAIFIDPFDRRNLATSSYDLRLGQYLYREQVPERQYGETVYPRIFNIYSEKHTKRVWGEYEQAQPAYVLFDNPMYNFFEPFEYDGIASDDKIIMIGPHETILGHTEEFIGGAGKVVHPTLQNIEAPGRVTTMMKARSSYGRCFIEICKCAGWGDVGYINRWTMEITNNSEYYTIPLVVGRRVAQMVFLETGPIVAKDYSDGGKYQTVSDLNDLRKSWLPSMMLPRLWSDRDIIR